MNARAIWVLWCFRRFIATSDYPHSITLVLFATDKNFSEGNILKIINQGVVCILPEEQRSLFVEDDVMQRRRTAGKLFSLSHRQLINSIPYTAKTQTEQKTSKDSELLCHSILPSISCHLHNHHNDDNYTLNIANI